MPARVVACSTRAAVCASQRTSPLSQASTAPTSACASDIEKERKRSDAPRGIASRNGREMSFELAGKHVNQDRSGGFSHQRVRERSLRGQMRQHVSQLIAPCTGHRCGGERAQRAADALSQQVFLALEVLVKRRTSDIGVHRKLAYANGFVAAC